MVRKRTRSLLEEFDDMLSSDKEAIIESRASHIIESAIKLINTIKENYDTQFSDELERRFLLSIKNQDYDKFLKGIRRIQASKLKVVEGKNSEN